jgi:hypothetical protein
MTSRRLFENLAYALVRKARPRMSFTHYEYLVMAVGDVLVNENPNFDWAKWYAATGVGRVVSDANGGGDR